MRREGWHNARSPVKGEERYTWDTRHWDDASWEGDRRASRRDREDLGFWEDEDELRRSPRLQALEKAFFRLVVIGLVALIAVQLWQRGSFDQVLQFSQFDGNALTSEQLAAARGESVPANAPEPLLVTVTLINATSAPDARLLLDGKEAGRFSDPTLTVAAPVGAVMRIDPGADRRQLTFRITALSDRNRLPRLGTQVTARGSAVLVGEVR